MDQTNLLENMVKFNNYSRLKTKEDKDKKRNTFHSVSVLYEGRELTLNAFRSGIFPTKEKQGKGLTPKQMFQRLPIALAQVKAGNTSENLLNEIRQITKKVCNNIMNSIKLENRIDTMFMNSENSKTSDPYGLLPNLSDKINFKRSDKYVALSNFSVYYTWK